MVHAVFIIHSVIVVKKLMCMGKMGLRMEETLEKLTVIYHQTGDHVERAAHIT